MTVTQRMSADQRREHVLEAALHEFAEHGYNAARTVSIAARAGVSQPYIYALFPDKKAVFLACQDLVRERIIAAFRAAARRSPASDDDGEAHAVAGAGQALLRLARGWRDLLPDQDLMRCQLQGFAASSDPEILASVRQGMMDSLDAVRELTGADRGQVADFVARGLLLNVGATLGLPAEYLPQPVQ